MLRTLIGLLLAIPSFAQGTPSTIQSFFAQAFEQHLQDEPEFATGVGRHEYDDRWTDWSRTGREQRRTHLRQRLEKLRTFPQASLSPADSLSARLMEYDLTLRLDAFDLEDELFAVMQQNGLHNRIYTVFDRMPARTTRDYQNLLARLRAIPVYIDQNIAMLEDAIAHGVVQPKIVVDLVLQQLDGQIAQDRNNTRLLAAFRGFPAAIPQPEQMKLRAESSDVYDHQFLPAWRKYRNYVAGKYARSVRATVGVSSIPNGRAAYTTLARFYTTTSTPPDQIHQLGLNEVKRIEGEMQTLIHQAGFSGSISDYERKLEASPDQHFHSKDEMLAYCRNVAKIVEPELPNQFRHVPQLLYGVRIIPVEREAATATNAQAPAPDFSTPGWMNLNTYQPEKQVKYDKQALVLHEAVPGHIFQLTLARALAGLPDFRRFYSNSAYVEGWGLYAESLGTQLGVYRDPSDHFGQLASERFRAVRLVVDTGLHSMGWTREQAIEYFKAHAPSESLAEVDRYIAWPSQALSYKMGQLKIRQLRTEAEQKLGTRFDIREFHELVLRDGVLPLELLQQQVESWLRASR
jgi:prolyl oligopeptidase